MDQVGAAYHTWYGIRVPGGLFRPCQLAYYLPRGAVLRPRVGSECPAGGLYSRKHVGVNNSSVDFFFFFSLTVPWIAAKNTRAIYGGHRVCILRKACWCVLCL